MKKFVVVIVVIAVFVLSLTSVNAARNRNAETLYRAEFVQRLSEDPEFLTAFLLAAGESDNLSDLEKAKKIFSETNIDCSWEKLRVNPREIVAPTDELTSEPASSWSGPTD